MPTTPGTVYTTTGKIKVIDNRYDPPRWRTIATYTDTPNARKEAIKRARKKTKSLLWIFDGMGKRPVE